MNDMCGIEQSWVGAAVRAVWATQRVARVKPGVERSDTLGYGWNMDLRPERAQEALEKTTRATSNPNHPVNGCLSRPFRADDCFVSFSQGIVLAHSAPGWVLMAFQAIH